MEEEVQLRQHEVEKLEAVIIKRSQELANLERALKAEEERLCRDLPSEYRNDITKIKPEDYSDIAVKLENRLKLQEMRNAILAREIHDTLTLERNIDCELENLECLNIQLQTATGYSTFHHLMGRGLSTMEQEEVVIELIFLKKVIKKEQVSSKTILKWKQDVLTKLQDEVQELDNVIEKIGYCHNDHNVMDNKLAEIQQDYNQLEDLHRKADGTLAVCEDRLASMTTAISLLGDKQFLKARSNQLKALRDEKERESKSLLYYSEMMEKRLAVINDALTDLKLSKEVNKIIERKSASAVVLPHRYEPIEWPPQEKVDMLLYELLTRDTKALKESLRLKDVLLYEKDTAIEAMEDKMNRIIEESEKQAAVTEEKLNKKERGLVKLHKHVDNQYQNYYREIQTLNAKRRKSQTKISKVLKKVDQMIETGVPASIRLQPVPGSPISRQSTRLTTPVSSKKKSKSKFESPAAVRSNTKPKTPATGRRKSTKSADSPIIATPSSGVKKSIHFSTPLTDPKARPKRKLFSSK
eukprot:TRINITY_DN8049_c0_g1_i1.p1 TRINITY_DN8049_c0_g1~~TRINITY_DN8049_c0_g1_i1.p1  ORF type:complete len:526 (+),score=128.65 TRINITY_DN8049_c0_g1_i1:58-1635(+)